MKQFYFSKMAALIGIAGALVGCASSIVPTPNADHASPRSAASSATAEVTTPALSASTSVVCSTTQREISSVGGPRCEELFPPPLHASKGRIFSAQGLQKFKGGHNRAMVYDFKPAQPGKRILILIHGLGDDLFALQRIAELAEKDGFGILRVDLHGHGATLENYLATHKGQLPTEIDYRENIDDIKKLIRYLNLTNFSLVGHSYGGGMALKLAEELPKKQVRSANVVFSVHAMAPYVQRIDKFFAQRMTAPDYMIASADNTVDKTPVLKPISNIFDPFFYLTWQMTRGIKVAQDLSNALLGFDKVKDMVMDPLMEPFLEKTYRSYFLKAMLRDAKKSESELYADEKALLEARVDAAILVTKGVRGLDYLDATTKIGKFPKIVQIIGGAVDKLVVPEQLKAFSLRLTQAGVVHRMDELQGDKATHLFPQTMPDEVYATILEAMNAPAEGAK